MFNFQPSKNKQPHRKSNRTNADDLGIGATVAMDKYIARTKERDELQGMSKAYKHI